MKTIEGYTPDQLLKQCTKMNDLIKQINDCPMMYGIRTPVNVIEWLAEQGKYSDWIFRYMKAFGYYLESDVVRDISFQMCPAECLQVNDETMILSVKPEYLK